MVTPRLASESAKSECRYARRPCVMQRGEPLGGRYNVVGRAPQVDGG